MGIDFTRAPLLAIWGNEIDQLFVLSSLISTCSEYKSYGMLLPFLEK